MPRASPPFPPMTLVLVHRIIARLNTGGPAMHVVHLAEALDATRFRTRLITGGITEDEGDMTYFARERGVEVTEIPAMSRLLAPWRDLKAFFSLLRIFLRERPTIIHTHTAKAGTLGRLAAIVARVPVIVHTFHGHVLGGLYSSKVKTRIFLEVERQLACATDRLVVLTHAQAQGMSDELDLADESRFSVVSLGLDLERFADVDRSEARQRIREQVGIEAERPVIGIVGRLVPVKNHELLFDALVRLTERMTPAPHVIVVGSGEREAELRMYVVDRELDRSVHWLGWRKDLPDLFPAFDVTALTSLDEGTPVSLLESLARGTPVVSRAVGGVAEILEDGALGSLVWGPSVDEFADALEEALRSPPDARAVERTRRRVLERYSVQRLAEDMEGLYADLLARAGLGRPEVTRTS